VLDGDPPSSLPKGAHPHNFRSMSIVAKRWPISATAEHWYTTRLEKARLSANYNVSQKGSPTLLAESLANINDFFCM